MHADAPALDFEKLLKAKPLPASSGLRSLMWLAVTIGIVTFGQGIISSDPGHTWFCFYWSLLFFMGLAAGGVMISAIFQITRATWSVPVRRLTEANVAFLPVALALFLPPTLVRSISSPGPERPAQVPSGGCSLLLFTSGLVCCLVGCSILCGDSFASPFEVI